MKTWIAQRRQSEAFLSRQTLARQLPRFKRSLWSTGVLFALSACIRVDKFEINEGDSKIVFGRSREVVEDCEAWLSRSGIKFASQRSLSLSKLEFDLSGGQVVLLVEEGAWNAATGCTSRLEISAGNLKPELRQMFADIIEYHRIAQIRRDAEGR